MDILRTARNLLAIAATVYILSGIGLFSSLSSGIQAQSPSVRYIGNTRVTSALLKPGPAPEPTISDNAAMRKELYAWIPLIFLYLVILGAMAALAKVFVVDSYIKLRAGTDPKYMIASTIANGKNPSKAVLDLYSGVTEEKRGYEKARRKNQTHQAKWRELRNEEYRNKLLSADNTEGDQEIEMPSITLGEAIEKSKPTSWIMGQMTAHQPRATANSVPLDSRKYSTYDFRRSGHIGILGGTGSGKTESSGMLAVYYARRFGLHVIMLDGKEGLDWRMYDGSIEWHNMNVDTLLNQLLAIHQIYRYRVSICLENEVNSIYALPKPLQPILVVMEEFGDTWEALRRQDKRAYDETAGVMDTLFRKARAMGIILCLIDQAPQNWTKQMRGNTKYALCYKLKGNVANGFNEYFVDQMSDFGQFSQNNTFYVPWHTMHDVDMSSMPRQPVRLLEPPAGLEGSGQIKTSMKHEPLAPPIANNELSGEYEEFVNTGKWEPYARKYFTMYPDHTATKLAKSMAHDVNDGRPWRNFYSVAHGLHKLIVDEQSIVS